MADHDTLAELAEEHMERMGSIPWDAYAASIRRGKSGESFGCTVDGRYYDVGDQASWLEEPEGDILLVTYAKTYAGENDWVGQSVERTTTINRPAEPPVR